MKVRNLAAMAACVLASGLGALEANAQAAVLYAEQEPTAAALFGERNTAAAWHPKPSFYVVSKEDMTISPDFERLLASRMKATTAELDAGHLSMVSHQPQIAGLNLAAAGREEVIELRGTG